MAENFSAFDYKTQEEVLTVIKHLTSVLSTAGMQLVEALSPSNLLDQLHGPADSTTPTEMHLVNTALFLSFSSRQTHALPQNGSPADQPPHSVELLRSSITIAMTMLLKAYLKSLYGLSEE